MWNRFDAVSLRVILMMMWLMIKDHMGREHLKINSSLVIGDW
jgi:hypothetical protein